MKHLIIDCDPGHDDIMALILALAHKDQLNILGITTVAGNAPVEDVTRNTLQFLDLVKEHIPVYQGASKPLICPQVTGTFAHGATGLGGVVLPETKRKVESEFAPSFMARVLKESQEPITLAVLGPMTNIALLLKTYPWVKERIHKICFMGGGLDRGNYSPVAEFNIYADPESAKIVFESGIPLVMIGMDVVKDISIKKQDWEALKDSGKVGKYVYDLLSYYHKVGRSFGYEDTVLYDAGVIAWLLREDLFEGKDYFVQVETKGEVTRGMTVGDKRPVPQGAPNVHVLLKGHQEEFSRLMIEAVRKVSQRSEE